MQLRTRCAASARSPQTHNLQCDQQNHPQDEDAVDEQHCHNNRMVGDNGRQASENQIGRQAGKNRQRNKHEAKNEGRFAPGIHQVMDPPNAPLAMVGSVRHHFWSPARLGRRTRSSVVL